MVETKLVKEVTNVELWADQINFYRTHQDIFIEDYLHVKLKDIQKVVAREFGCSTNLCIVKSRGFGKTWLMAICCIAMCIQYPGTLIAVISNTAEQASQLTGKIEKYFSKLPDVAREIEFTTAGNVLRTNRGRDLCKFKNGSEIETYTMNSFRGNRVKIVVIDEAPLVKKEDLVAVVRPAKNYKRSVCQNFDLEDYDSKEISITSACLKSNPFFDTFTHSMREMFNGNPDHFACALDYRAAVHAGITEMRYFMEEKKTMPQSTFDMEYGSIFVGAEANSVFPYDVTEPCRTLTDVEVYMPKNSKSSYVIGIDLATSGRKDADNAVFSVWKLVEKGNGEYLKKMVCIRTYHGKRLDYLANETRRMQVRFPNTIKVVFDHRGLGDSFPQFLSQPWTDPESGKEYPPLVCDDENVIIHNAQPLLRSVKANVQVNQQMASSLRVGLEQETVLMPVSSRLIFDNKIVFDDEEDTSSKKRVYSTEEQAIFIETDALQIEMGNIITKVSSGGSYLYETAKTTQHKDRYSSVAMAVRFIAELEEQNKKKLNGINKNTVLGSIGYAY